MNARNLMLKTVGPNGEAFGGFKWPLKIGAVVHARDWNNTRVCGGGLHGFLHGRGDGYLANWNSDAKWIVAECLEAMVKLDGKVKCKSAIIRFIGTRKEATDFIMGHVGAYGVIGATLTGGDHAKLTGGYRATLIGGNYATLTGGDGALLIGGEGSKFRAGIGSTFFDEYNKVVKMVDGVTIKAGVFYRYDTIWEECDV